MGTILASKDDLGREQMIYAYGIVIDPTHKNYFKTDKELLTVIKVLHYFRNYLWESRLALNGSQASLTMLRTKEQSSGILRQSHCIQGFCFSIEYVQGEENAADVLSRPINPRLSINSMTMANPINNGMKAVILGSTYCTRIRNG